MKIVNGKFATAKIYSDTADEYAMAQIRGICNNETAEKCKICVMPDVHPGKVGPIGLTMTIGNKIMPSLIGIDIGCGVSYIRIKQTKIEFGRLDTVIRENIPAGYKIRKNPHLFSKDFEFEGLTCRKRINEEKAVLSLGTLGGGNHFIELDKDEDGQIYAMVHSGSRHLGKEVTEFYLSEGQKRLKEQGIEVPYELTWLEGQLMEDYLHDLQEVQGFAMLNREIILDEMARAMKWKTQSIGGSIHNYVEENEHGRILRKGAISAEQDDEVVIPINMHDGIILGNGKGNADWNYSAPHGAGRILRRDEVKQYHTVSEYKKMMKGIYSPSINKNTLDEAPFAYRGMDEIMAAVKDTLEVKRLLKPVYNFKAGEER